MAENINQESDKTDKKTTVGFQKYKLEIVLAIIGIVAIFLLPMAFFVAVGQDDGFMYLTLARSNANGHLFSADNGNSITNGFQILWYIILSIIFWLNGSLAISNYSTAKIAFSLSWILLIFSSYLAKRIIQTTRFNKVALASQLLIIFNPMFISTALNGLETTLYGTLLLLITYLVVYKKNPKLIAMVSALTILTRLDAILFLAPLLLIAEKEQKKAIIFPAIFTYAAYIAANFLIFNQLTPYPQQLKAFHLTSIYEFLTNGILTFARSARDVIFIPKVLALLVLATSFLTLFKRYKINIEEKELKMLASMLLSALMFATYYSFIVFPAPWHLYPVMLIAWGILTPLGLTLVNSLSKNVRTALLLLLVMEIALGAGYLLVFPRTYNNVFSDNAIEMSGNFPGSTVCAYNFGLIAFFAANNTAINIDGLMNNEAAQALLKNDSSDITYIEEHCDFVIDAASSAQRRYLWRGGAGEIVKNVTLSPRKCILEYCNEEPKDYFIWIAVSPQATLAVNKKYPYN